MDRTAEAGKTKGGGVCFMINKKWCDPRNVSIIFCPFYLPWEFSSIVVTAVFILPQADTSLALSKLHDELSGYIIKHPDAASIIAGDFNKANLKKVMPNFHQPVSVFSPAILKTFYSGAIESVLTQCGIVTPQNRTAKLCRELCA